MSRLDKLLERMLAGAADANLAFDDLRNILKRLGFSERIRGSHHMYSRPGIPELLNIQRHGKDAKP